MHFSVTGMIITMSQSFSEVHGFLASLNKEGAYHQGLRGAMPGDWQMFLISTIPNDCRSLIRIMHGIC